MADHAVDDNDGNIFIYRGGRAPQHITHVLIDKSIIEIEDDAFYECGDLAQVDTHDGIRKVGKYAFMRCKYLRRINIKSVIEIDHSAFYMCENLESVEFGDGLETIRNSAFGGCTALEHLKLPSIINIGKSAFWNCKRMTDVELSERLETIEARAFRRCVRLQRISIPLKRGLLEYDDEWEAYDQFHDCEQPTTVDLVGGVHKTIASLHMDNWRTEMISEINRINQHLPTTPASEKTDAIRQWIDSVIDKMDHYKAKHYRHVKEGITLLELALWKFKLGENEDNSVVAEDLTEKAKVDAESARKEGRITCGADMVIKNVLPFLKLG